MTTYNWSGDKGSYVAVRHWSPQDVPGMGDTALIVQGEIVVRQEDVQARVLIGGTDAGSPLVLDMRNSSVDVLTATGNPYVPYSTGADAPQAAPGIGVSQITGGAFISHLPASTLAGATLLPMQA